MLIPPASNGSTSSSETPAQPTQMPSCDRIIGSSAATRPPGEGRQSAFPSSSSTRSTGSRLDTMTRSYVSSSLSVVVAFVAFVVVESGFAVMVGQLPQGVAVDTSQGTSVLQPRPGRTRVPRGATAPYRA